MSPDSNHYPYDVFISHASDDKDVVRPLARELEHLGLEVWYDEDEIRIGDSIRASIDEGLRKSDYGIVVLSEAFFATEWTEFELNALVSRQHEEDGKVILPLWYGIGKDFLMDISPLLVDMRAGHLDEDSIVETARNLVEVVEEDTDPRETKRHWAEVTTDPATDTEGDEVRYIGYLSPVDSQDDTVKQVGIAKPVGVFRRDESVLVETDGETIDIGLEDVTVSRKSDGVAPIQFSPRTDGILVRNAHNRNDVTVRTGVETIELEEGSERVVDQDSTVTVGFNAELLLTVENEVAGEQPGKRTLSIEEYREQLGVESEGAVTEGIDPTALARSAGERARTQIEAAGEASDVGARVDALNECLICAQELRDLLVQHPVGGSVYDEVVDDVERAADDIERARDESNGDGIGVDRGLANQVRRVTERVERLYAREG